MHPEWNAFLQSRGADTSRPAARFPGPAGAATPACALIDLSDQGMLSVQGPDAVTFLQGQVSNDVREVSASHTQMNSHCSPKGRMLANFRVVRDGEGLLLLLPRVQVEPLRKRLGLFLLRSQAKISDVSDERVTFGLIGTGADRLLSARFGGLPALEGGLVSDGDCLLLRIPGTPARYQCIAPVAAARELWAELADTATETNVEHWALADIRAGIPWVLPETAESFVPQMANMQLIDGVSFHKGCYCGQEVVARMQYLGKLKRRMYYGRVAADALPRPGDDLHVPGSTSGQWAGRVVQAQRGAPGEVELLAVVEISAAEGGEVRLREDGPPLALSAPPYGLPADA